MTFGAPRLAARCATPIAFRIPYLEGHRAAIYSSRSRVVSHSRMPGCTGIPLSRRSVGNAVRRQFQSVQSWGAALDERALGVATRSLNLGARARRDEYGQAWWHHDQCGSAGYRSQCPPGETQLPDRALEGCLLSDA